MLECLLPVDGLAQNQNCATDRVPVLRVENDDAVNPSQKRRSALAELYNTPQLLRHFAWETHHDLSIISKFGPCVKFEGSPYCTVFLELRDSEDDEDSDRYSIYLLLLIGYDWMRCLGNIWTLKQDIERAMKKAAAEAVSLAASQSALEWRCTKLQEGAVLDFPGSPTTSSSCIRCRLKDSPEYVAGWALMEMTPASPFWVPFLSAGWVSSWGLRLPLVMCKVNRKAYHSESTSLPDWPWANLAVTTL